MTHPSTRAAVYTRAAIYTRVSKDMRDTGRSVEQQETECRAWVEREPAWELAGVWSDNDRSASQYATKGRPDWERLIEEISSGDIGVLVVWEPARATRDRVVWAALAALCEAQGVLIAASGRVYDLSDPEDAFQLDLFFSLAARESRVTRKRIKRDQRSQAAKGRPHGRLPYGYRREYHPSTGALLRQVPNDLPRFAFSRICFTAGAFTKVEVYTTAGIIREIARRVLRGVSTTAIAQDLNRRGIPAPRHSKTGWEPNAITAMILSPTYAGLRVYDGEVVGDADWDGLISLADHYTLVSKLGDPARRTFRDGAVVHLLSGILVCSVCRRTMGVVPNAGFPLYQCTTKKTLPGETGYHTGRSKARMDELVVGLVVGRLSRPDAAEMFVRDDKEATELKRLLDEVAEKRARLQEHYALSADGQLSAMALAGVESRLLPQIEAAEAKARRIRMVPLLGDLIIPDAEQVHAAWKGLMIEQQREVIRALFTSITVSPLGRGRRASNVLDGIDLQWRTAS